MMETCKRKWNMTPLTILSRQWLKLPSSDSCDIETILFALLNLPHPRSSLLSTQSGTLSQTLELWMQCPSAWHWKKAWEHGLTVSGRKHRKCIRHTQQIVETKALLFFSSKVKEWHLISLYVTTNTYCPSHRHSHITEVRSWYLTRSGAKQVFDDHSIEKRWLIEWGSTYTEIFHVLSTHGSSSRPLG